MSLLDEHFMRQALELANTAGEVGEVPVGAVVVKDGEVIGRGYNLRETTNDPLAHAEMLAIAQSCRSIGSWRLDSCTLYVTLEPCPMCTGAIINARVGRVVWGAADPKAGCFGSVASLCDMPFNHCPARTGGCLAKECGDILSDFFAKLRIKKADNR